MTTPQVAVELLRRRPDGDLGEWPVLQDGSEQSVARSRIAYMASLAGGQVAFNITTDVVQIPAAGQQPLAALWNPADSGLDLWFHVGEFGSGSDALFRRYNITELQVTSAGNAPRNMTGGSTTSPFRMYPAGQYTATLGVPSKTAHISAFEQYLTRIEGASRLRPGRGLAWTIENASGGVVAFTGSIYFELWQEPAA